MTGWVAGKLLEMQKERIGQPIQLPYTAYGHALGIKYLEQFDADHVLTEAEEREFLRCKRRRRKVGDAFPLIAI